MIAPWTVFARFFRWLFPVVAAPFCLLPPDWRGQTLQAINRQRLLRAAAAAIDDPVFSREAQRRADLNAAGLAVSLDLNAPLDIAMPHGWFSFVAKLGPAAAVQTCLYDPQVAEMMLSHQVSRIGLGAASRGRGETCWSLVFVMAGS